MLLERISYNLFSTPKSNSNQMRYKMKKISILLSVLLLISCANENKTEELTIYTSRQPQLLEPIIEDFYDDTGIKVNLLSGNAQELMERIDIEDTGSPFIVVEPAEKLGKEHCSVICYKNKKDIPAKYYERLGYRKPE